MVPDPIPPLGNGQSAPRTMKELRKQVMRPDIYEEAMKEIGYEHGGLNNEQRDPLRWQ